VVDLISDVKGENIVLMDLQSVSLMADYFVIGTANSDRQLNAIIDKIREGLKADFKRLPIGVEGRGDSGWVLLDYGDVIIHLFTPNARRYYDLEGLWSGAPILVRMM
jgi:ribosome-associated protein